MADSAYLPGLAVQNPALETSRRHSLLVRVTHWITALSFLGLLASGIPIVLAHPRLYWGETGNIETPSLIDLPLPFVLEIPMRGPARYLHFTFAWALVLTGILYVVSGFLNGHFKNNLLPTKSDLSWRNISGAISSHLHLKPPANGASYNVLQRIAYLKVVFILVPLMIWTGLAMSPSVTSALPFLVNALGGQQSARTIHFFVACSLAFFLVVHVVMVWLAGFTARTRGMITGERT
jgi:thiosulfate reductase cytochrome b subunit